MQNLRQFGVLVTLAAACLAAGAQHPPAPRQPLPLRWTARRLHNLPPEQAAQAFSVRLRAVVIYYDPYIDARHGALFVRDRSGGVFVSVPARPILPLWAGDLVEISGVTAPGDYAPVVAASQVRLAGRSQLPANPPRVTLAQLLSGVTDCQWIEIEGRVRAARLGPHNVVLQIATDGGSFTAASVRQAGADYQSLIDSLVRVRGVAAPVFNQRRQMVGVHLFFPSLRQVQVVTPAPGDPFASPAVPVSRLFRFTPVAEQLHRVHVQGRVTLDWPGRMLCIQDEPDGICIQTAQATSVALGSLVDVVGFPAISQFKPTLEDATYRLTGSPSAPAPALATAGRAERGDLDGQLVQIDAELIGQDFGAPDPTLMLRAGRFLFPAILPKDAAHGASALWKDGSILRITGICNVQVDPLNTSLGEGAVRPESVQILLRSVDDVSVLHAPSWWTPRHALEGFAIVGIVVLAAFFWIVVLRRRVEQQTRALRGSEERLRFLSEHDVLTALPNRILLNDRLQMALGRAQRFESCLGLLMVDVDGFKQVNDALGHQAGDRLLCELAARLNGCVRTTDTVARIGGDEFIVLLPDLHIPAQAETIAAKIVAAVATPFEIDRAQAVITVSIGVVTYPEASSNLEGLMQCADDAMYAAKERGKNGFQVYRPKAAARGADGQALCRVSQVAAPADGA